MTRRVAALAASGVLAVLGMGVAEAAWQHAGAGSATAKSATMPPGSILSPAGGTSTSRIITVSWAAASYVGPSPAVPVPGHTIQRYRDGQLDSTLSSGCAGVRTGTSCTDTVPGDGAYRYSVRPVSGQWLGTASALSGTVTVTTATVNSGPIVTPQCPTAGGSYTKTGSGTWKTTCLDRIAVTASDSDGVSGLTVSLRASNGSYFGTSSGNQRWVTSEVRHAMAVDGSGSFHLGVAHNDLPADTYSVTVYAADTLGKTSELSYSFTLT